MRRISVDALYARWTRGSRRRLPSSGTTFPSRHMREGSVRSHCAFLGLTRGALREAPLLLSDLYTLLAGFMIRANVSRVACACSFDAYSRLPHASRRCSRTVGTVEKHVALRQQLAQTACEVPRGSNILLYYSCIIARVPYLRVASVPLRASYFPAPSRLTAVARCV